MKNPDTESASLPPSGNLKFEREDWSLFRTVEGLQQRAGVSRGSLSRLVLKELADNALDAGGSVEFGELPDGKGYYIADDGPGIDPEEIARLFSINRPMVSTKLLRLPQRGALGNGLRVVAGAVLASEGSLTVITRNRRIVLRPEADGTTTVVESTAVDHPAGTRVEIVLGETLPHDTDAFAWARLAAAFAETGENYDGRSSPHWYDPVHFHELLLAHGRQPVRALVAEFDGCSEAKAGEVVAAAGLRSTACDEITREQAQRLLAIARANARPVKPERLGQVGRDVLPEWHHAIERGSALLGTAPQASIPFVAEARARKKSEKGDLTLKLLINRSPVAGDIGAYRDTDKDLCLYGAGLNHYVNGIPTKGAYAILVNVTTPFCPLVSDGKTPDITPFFKANIAAVGPTQLLQSPRNAAMRV